VHFRLLIPYTDIPVQGFSARGVQQTRSWVKNIQKQVKGGLVAKEGKRIILDTVLDLGDGKEVTFHDT
jgi:hypothetical protein